MALEKTGVQLVAENADKAIKQVQQFDKAVDQLNKTTGQAEKGGSAFQKLDSILGSVSKKASDFSSRMGKVSSELKSTLGNLTNIIPGAGKLTNVLGQAEGVLGSFGSALSGIASPAGIAAIALGAVAVALAGIITLGARGAQLQVTAQAFGNIVGEANSATGVLDGLRRATRGAVSDFELMRLATVALQGQQSEFKNELLAVASDGTTALGRVIDATRRIAQATGQNEALIREKFLYGLRLQSKLRLDDVGVMVDQATAERNYAKALGVSTAALTEQQKKAAFAREALRQLDEVAAGLGDRSTALDNFARPLVVIQNIMDKLAVAALPAFEPIAALMAAVANAVESMANLAFPIIERLGQLIGNLIGVSLLPLKLAFAAIRFVVEPLLPILYYQIAAITLLLDAINALLEPLANIGDSFSQVGNSASGFANTFSAVANVIGSVASTIAGAIGGILSPITNTFSAIAQNIMISLNFIAAGLSAMISNAISIAGQGGGAIIGAFAAGLLRGGTQVVQAVTAIAQIVADFLQGFSPPKVGPLSRIDEGGFNVARAWAEGFQKGFVQPGETIRDEITSKLGEIGNLVATDLEARFRTLDIALMPFNEQLQLAKARVEEIAGFVDPALKSIERQRKAALQAFSEGKTDAESIRALDRQVDRLKAIRAQGEALSDQAEIELAFAKSSQAVERAKLEIQKKRLEMFDKEAAAAEAASTAGGGGGGGAGSAAKEQAAKEAKAKEEKAPKGGAAAPAAMASGGLSTGEAPNLLANTAIDNARAGITGFFGKVGDLAKGAVGGIAGKVGEAGGILGAGFAEGFSNSGFDAALADFTGSTGDLKAQIAEISSADPVGAITEKFAGLGSILTEPLAGLTESVSATFGPDGSIAQAASGLFGEDGLFGANGIIANSFSTLFGEGSPLFMTLGAEGTLATAFTSMSETVKSTVTGMVDSVRNDITGLQNDLFPILSTIGQTVLDTFTNPALSPFQQAKTTIGTIFSDITNTLKTFADTDIGQAFSGVAANLTTSLLTPFVSTINSIIDAFNDAINGVINGLPGFLRGALSDLGINSVNIGHISIPGAARGALNLRGLAMVGENGPELVNFRRPANVFPNNLSQQMMDFMGNGMSPIVGGTSTTNNVTNNNQRTITNNLNGMSAQQSILFLRELEAL